MNHRRVGVSHIPSYALYLLAGVLCVYFLFVLARAFKESIIIQKRDRINIVYYGRETELISIGLTDGVHYIVSFSQNNKVSVPGGYGRYNVGALGKLAALEKTPDLIGKTFSSMISAHVDYYILPKEPEVYSGEDTDSPMFSQKSAISQMFSGPFVTNAHIFDKLYIAFLLSQRRQKDFAVLRSLSEEGEDGNINFSERRFLKKFKGFFYHQSLRQEEKEVQIVYHRYSAATTLSRVIEGQGVRVVDLADGSISEGRKKCVLTAEDTTGKTIHYLARMFNCDVQKGSPEASDIKLVMGTELTEQWK